MKSTRTLLTDLQELADIAPDAEATRRAIDHAHAAILQTLTVTTTSKPWGRKIMSLRNVGAVAAALAVIFVLTHWLTPAGSPGGLAFADVQAQVAKTRTVQYVETRTNRRRDGQPVDGMVRRVKILGAHLMREELTKTPGDEQARGGTLLASDYVQIHDAKSGIMLTLYPDKKAYEYVTRILGLTKDGDVVESKPEPNPQIDFYARIRDIPADKAVKLTDKFVNGKVATGFEVSEKIESPAGDDTFTRRYWVDPGTQLPVRIEVSFRTTRAGSGESDWLQGDFVFDEPLDESLFSTDPPAGYKDRAAERKPQQINK